MSRPPATGVQHSAQVDIYTFARTPYATLGIRQEASNAAEFHLFEKAFTEGSCSLLLEIGCCKTPPVVSKQARPLNRGLYDKGYPRKCGRSIILLAESRAKCKIQENASHRTSLGLCSLAASI